MKKTLFLTIILWGLSFLSAQDCLDDPTGALPASCDVMVNNWGMGCDGIMNGYTVGDVCPVTCGTSGADDPTGALPASCDDMVNTWGIACDGIMNGYTVGDVCQITCGTCSTGPSGCDLPEMSLSILDDGTVLYNMSEAIAGFEFMINGGTLNGDQAASGGAAGVDGADFNLATTPNFQGDVSTPSGPAPCADFGVCGEGKVLGASFFGTTIPPSCGTLVELDFESGSPNFLHFIIVAGANGEELLAEYVDPPIVSGCQLPDYNLYVTEEGLILYNTSEAIGGFEFTVDGASLNGGSAASGGDAGAEGFTMSTNPESGKVLGFSLTGSTFGPACGTMLEMDILDGIPTGLLDIVIADAVGGQIPFSNYGVPSSVPGCMNYMACNYNADATEDDGSCEYAMENYDCDGNCTAGEDCAGQCGGSAVEDNCGICDADSSNDCEQDCAEEWGGSATWDYYYYDLDGDGLGAGDAFIYCSAYALTEWVTNNYDWDDYCTSNLHDECGICDGDNSSCSDCAGVPNGTNVEDNCGTCDDNSSNDCVQDCAGEWGGSAVVTDYYNDLDGDGLGAGTPINNCSAYAPAGWVSNNDDVDDSCFSNIHDCAGVCDGTVMIDDCGVCNGQNSDMDCADECFGSSVVDNCGTCDSDSSNDCIQDCAGTWGGGAVDDGCGVCNGDNSSCGIPETFIVNQSNNIAFYYFYSVTINTVVVEPNDWVGAFNGDVCVGSRQWDTSQCNGGTCDIVIMGYDSSSPELTGGYMMNGNIPVFKIYDTSEDAFYEATASTNSPWYNTGIIIIDSLSAYEIIEGCMDAVACNYNPDAIVDDGSCDYAQANYNCDGNCVIDIDCNGECGGSALTDNCGICDNDNTNDCVQDCADVWGGEAYIEDYYFDFDGDGLGAGESIYVCNGFDYQGWVTNNSDSDDYCTSNIHDDCGVCDGNNTECADCAGVANGTNWESDCGCVAVDNDGNACDDCASVPDGDSWMSDCGCVSADNSGDECDDCAEIPNGTAWMSDCGCVAADNDGNNCDDCAGIPNGSAILDDCSVCDGNCVGDGCVYCDGTNDSACDVCADCDGVANGTSWESDCGCVAVDNDGNDCDDCAGVPNGTAWMSDCGCVAAGNDGNDCDDCAGVPDGDATEDSCGVCGGDAITCETPLEFNFNQSTQQAFYYIFSARDIYGNPLVSGEDWIGIFNGDICVGARQWTNEMYTDIPAMGDDDFFYSSNYLVAGEIPSFQIYDASEDLYYVAKPSEDYGFEVNGSFLLESLKAGLDYALELDGVDLISFYALPDDASLESMTAGLDGNIFSVLGEGVAAYNLNENGGEPVWIGSLDEFTPDRAYWIIIPSPPAALADIGLNYDPDRVYDLHTGANLISFSDTGSVDIAEAIPDDVEDLFEAILTAGGAAMNTEDGWMGSLASFDGGSGYWIVASDDLSFSFQLDGLARSEITRYVEELPTGSAFNVAQSPHQAFYFVDTITLDEGFIEDGDWLLSYNGSVLTGIRQWQGVMIDIPAMGLSDITPGYFKDGERPTFKLLQHSTGEYISLGGDIQPWSENGVYTLSGLVEMQPLPDEFLLKKAYPNPFNPVTTLEFGLPVDGNVSIDVYNLQGRLLETLAKSYMDAGYHSVIWNADHHASGVYFVTMTVGGHINTQKLMLVK